MNKFLTLVFIAFASLAVQAKDFYLTGEFNGWKPNIQSCKFSEENGVYTLYMESVYGELKITTPDWGEQYGCSSRIEYGKTFSCVKSDNGYNMSLPDNPAKNITITFDYNNKTVRFDKTEILYLVGDFNEWLILPEYAFTFSEGVYTLRTKSFSGRFKIATENYGYSFGMGGEVVLNGEHSLKEGGDDMTFAGTSDRILVTFNPDASNAGTASDIAGNLDRNEPVEYYNLQGLRVNNPENGYFIRRQGNVIEKIFIR